MSKISVQMVQLSNVYGNNVFIPYSVGVLRAYCERDRLIKDKYEFRPFLYKRNSLDVLVDKIGEVDILCLSCYIWNWKLSTVVASQVRKRYKDCLIIVGGPQIPDRAKNFFKEYPYLDMAVHGEGEKTFYQLLKAYVNEKPFTSIPGLSYYNRETKEFFYTGKREEIVNIDDILSPYLNGTFKELLENEGADWVASWETNRGCPFSCSYCYWGKHSQKIRKFGLDRLYKEMEWFGKNKIPLVFGCDANFGILNRDFNLVKQLARTKKIYGYPRTFRACDTKNSNERVFNIGKILYESAMSKGSALGMQSLSNEVLKNIKRINMKINTFHNLQTKYMKEGIPTYTELIIALPGETYDTFVSGINTLLENGQHSQIHLYNCSILVNSEMAQKRYRKKHGIQTVKIPIFQAHSTPDASNNNVTEYEEIVISTNTMSVDDWRRAYHFAWAVLCFHYLGTFQIVANLLYGRYKIKYSRFYESLVQHACQNQHTLIGRELTIFDKVLDNVLKGIGFDQYLPEFGDVTWPPEEASFLRLSKNIDALYQEFAVFLNNFLLANNIEPENDLIKDVLKYQRARLVHYDDNNSSGEEFILDLNCNLPEYIDSVMKGVSCLLKPENKTYVIVRNQGFAGDKKRFAREVVWYGRKGGKYLHAVKVKQLSGKNLSVKNDAGLTLKSKVVKLRKER